MAATPIDTLIAQAKYDLLVGKFTNAGFLGALLVGMPIKKDDRIPLVATDGESFYVNPANFSHLTRKERLSWMELVTWHVVLLHFARRGFKEKDYFVPACIHVVMELMHKGNRTVPAAMQYNPDYEGKSVEQLTAYLINQGNPPSCISTLLFINKPEKLKEVKEKREIQVQNAAIAHKPDIGDFGDSNCGMLVQLQRATAPRIDWQSEVLSHATMMIEDDYSYRRPNRHYQEFIVPTALSPGIGSILFACDSSASVTDKEFSAIASLVDNVMEVVNPQSANVWSFDVHVNSRHSLPRGQSAHHLNFTGRGGTSLTHLFEEAKKQAPDLMIVFSDLDCAPQTTPPNFPVIWVCINNAHATVQFGRLIHAEVEIY